MQSGGQAQYVKNHVNWVSKLLETWFIPSEHHTKQHTGPSKNPHACEKAI